MKSKIILFSSITGVFLLTIIYVFVIRKTQSESIQTSVIIQPTEVPPNSMGYDSDTEPNTTTEVSKKRTQLQQQLPITTSSFTITYNPHPYKYTVKIQPPFTESRKVFDDWIKSQGFQLIPLSEFEIK